ncbi:MAG: apolipoprotein N-acyltransferase [Polyangiales bacterium]|nr:apolipoprotein N-acyltransferase [Myxococcales bacterium]
MSACSGALYFLAFAGFDIWPLAFVAFVPHLIALERGAKTRRQELALGFAFGLVMNVGGYYWLIGMLRDFSGFPYVLCVLLGLLVCAYQAGQLGVFAVVWAWLARRGVPATVGVPLVLGAVEWLYPFLFHSYFGNCVHGVPVLMQVADIGGPLLLTAILAAINGAIFELLRARWARAPIPYRRLGAVALLVVFTVGYGVFRIRQVDARTRSAPSLDIALVQANMGLFSKHLDPFEGLTRHLDQSLTVERESEPDLIVWPESAYTFLIPEEVTNLKRTVTGELRTPLLFGGLLRRRQDGESAHYNTAFLLDREGEIQGTYDKVYLLPFGEYLPFGTWFPKLYELSPHTGRFTPGNTQSALEFRGHRIAPLVCYEDIIPEFVRRAVVKNDAELLVNMTNDAWFGDTTEPWEHLALAKFRAVEHHRYLVRATNSGVSAVIDPVGRVVLHGRVFHRETLEATVHWMNGSTIYQYVGDFPGWGSLIALTAFAFWDRRLRLRNSKEAEARTSHPSP